MHLEEAAGPQFMTAAAGIMWIRYQPLDPG